MVDAVNLTNESVISTVEHVPVVRDFIPLLFSRLWDWIIFPLLFTLIVMEFYYDRNRNEELGWGSAIANSLILIIVSIDLLKHAFHYASPFVVLKEIGAAIFSDAVLPLEPQVLILILFLGILGISITIVNYFHLMPRKLAFIISGHPPVNYLAYFAIVIVYSTGTSHPVPFDIITLIAGAVLFVLLCVVFFSIKKGIERITGRNDTAF